MILRHITEHVKAQNWLAIAIDFVIVVVGVFIGIQVSNWNAARALSALEREKLAELRIELEEAVSDTRQWQAFLGGVSAAGERSLAFLERGEACTDDCWRVLVGFFHASQLTDVTVSRETYDAMRRMGLPRSRAVVSALDRYYALNAAIAANLNERPAYRNLARSLIPVGTQRVLWLGCHDSEATIETFDKDCPSGVSDEAARKAVDAILAEPDLARTLTQWTAVGVPRDRFLADQNGLAAEAIAAIDAELRR